MLKRISWYMNGMLLGRKESSLSGCCQDKNCKEVHIPKFELQYYFVQSHCKLVLFSFFEFTSSANASPEFEGRGGEELGSMLAKTLERAYNHPSAIDLESLCILPGKQCWILYIDAVVSLSN